MVSKNKEKTKITIPMVSISISNKRHKNKAQQNPITRQLIPLKKKLKISKITLEFPRANKERISAFLSPNG